MLHFLLMILLMGAFYPLWRQKQGFQLDAVDGDPLLRSIYLLGYLLVLLYVLFTPRKVIKIALRAPLIWLLVFLSLVSMLWSDFPNLTLRRSFAIILTSLYGLALAVRFKFRQVLLLLGWALGVVLVFSLLLIVFAPDWGTMIYAGEVTWRGVFEHKNRLGSIAVLALLVFFTLWLKKTGGNRAFWMAGFLLAGLLLVGSRSSTALVLAAFLAIGAAILGFLKKFHRDWQLTFPVLLLCGALAVLFIVLYYEEILVSIGRETTLTGRVPLWNVLINIGMSRPWLGFGYRTFWLGWEGPSAEVWKVITWLPNQGHNGYIDIWLELGFIGLLVAVIVLFWLFVRSFQYYTKAAFEASFWVLLTGFFILQNFSESPLLRQHDLFWVLIVYSSISITMISNSEREPG